MFDFTDVLEALDESVFEEEPVDLQTFLYSEDYSGLTKLSEAQEALVDMISQVYRYKDLERLYGVEEAEKMWAHTKNEILMLLGKGSGKDFTSTVGCSYLVYKLLCLKDPAKYFNKPSGDAIDILNIAINSQQANNVFFKGFKTRIQANPWFAGKYIPKGGSIEFDKHITVHSGHSEREAWEGYNVILVILDEIAGFAMENASGREGAKTAADIYLMYQASVASRFPDVGKLVMLSFPRYKGDFITTKYNEWVAEKEVVEKTYTFKMNEEIPDGIAENELTITWEEDHIVSYTRDKVFALRRPSWYINPTRKIEDYKGVFISNPTDALMRFACMPPDAIDAFFKDHVKLERAFSNPFQPFDDDGQWNEMAKPDKDKLYFIHVDLAQKHDYCAVAMSHVDSWVALEGSGKHVQPKLVVDFVRYWKPRPDKPLDLEEVVKFILSARFRGYNIKLTTFDRWNSIQTRMDLDAQGMKNDLLSVGLDHYTDFVVALNEERIVGPSVDVLITELKQLRIIKGKIDHPRTGTKDLSDAVCGALYNAAKHTPRNEFLEIDVHAWDAPMNDIHEDRVDDEVKTKMPSQRPGHMPPELQDFLAGMRVL